MRILHLTLKKKWFDMILSGEKKEEYRDIKPYWSLRLVENSNDLKQFDIIRFQHGYAANCPTMDVECKGIDVNVGVPEWGAEYGKAYFVISLGKILSTSNINPATA